MRYRVNTHRPVVRALLHGEQVTSTGQRLQAFREALDLDRRGVAEKLGVHVKTPGKWERGEQNLDRHLSPLAELLGVPENWETVGLDCRFDGGIYDGFGGKIGERYVCERC